MPGTKSPLESRAELGVHGGQCEGDRLSIGRACACGKFRLAIAVIQFMNEYFIYQLNNHCCLS